MAVTDALTARLSALDHAEASVVVDSGIGAIACTMLALLRPGDQLLASHWLRDDTRLFLEHELTNCGIDVCFVDPSATRGWRRAARPNTRLLLIESPSDTRMRLVDLKPAHVLSQELGIALVVDSTMATPLSFRPVLHGADVVLHTSSTVLSGDPTSRHGVVSASVAVVDEVRTKAVRWGRTAMAGSLHTLRDGLDTLDARVRRVEESAMHIARWAASTPSIRTVRYYGLVSHPDHALATTYLTGFGATLTLEFDGDAASAHAFVSRLALFDGAATYAGIVSVARVRPISDVPLSNASTTRAAPQASVWLGVGLEDPAALIADLSNALN